MSITEDTHFFAAVFFYSYSIPYGIEESLQQDSVKLQKTTEYFFVLDPLCL